MSERQNNVATGTRDVFVVVQERLKELRKPHSIESLKQLYWKDLSYLAHLNRRNGFNDPMLNSSH